jgi:triosephosphate isomerase
MARKILIAGNWKMNKTAAEGAELAKAIVKEDYALSEEKNLFKLGIIK